MPAQKNSLTIYRLKVTLKDSEPVIWRRFLVPSTITLHRLHLILQDVMGWTNTHLYEFEINKKQYGMLAPDDDFDELKFIDSNQIDYELLSGKSKKILAQVSIKSHESLS
jgi:hypothetical protein